MVNAVDLNPYRKREKKKSGKVTLADMGSFFGAG